MQKRETEDESWSSKSCDVGKVTKLLQGDFKSAFYFGGYDGLGQDPRRSSNDDLTTMDVMACVRASLLAVSEKHHESIVWKGLVWKVSEGALFHPRKCVSLCISLHLSVWYWDFDLFSSPVQQRWQCWPLGLSPLGPWHFVHSCFTAWITGPICKSTLWFHWYSLCLTCTSNIIEPISNLFVSFCCIVLKFVQFCIVCSWQRRKSCSSVGVGARDSQGLCMYWIKNKICDVSIGLPLRFKSGLHACSMSVRCLNLICVSLHSVQMLTRNMCLHNSVCLYSVSYLNARGMVGHSKSDPWVLIAVCVCVCVFDVAVDIYGAWEVCFSLSSSKYALNKISVWQKMSKQILAIVGTIYQLCHDAPSPHFCLQTCRDLQKLAHPSLYIFAESRWSAYLQIHSSEPVHWTKIFSALTPESLRKCFHSAVSMSQAKPANSRS